MIRLNDINLLSISLRGIRLSKISLGRSSGGGVPPVPPLRPIAYYRTAGKTNQDADRDVLKDLTGNGHDIVLKNFGFTLGSGYEDGALVFDGVDDYGICESFPVLTKESGYSIVMLRQYIDTVPSFYIASDGVTIPDTSFIFECAATTETRNFGTSTKNLTIPHSLSIQTSEQYNGQKLIKGSNTKGSGILQVGVFSRKYCKCAIWEIQIYDRPLTEEEIQNITDMYKKKYPQLFIDEV